MDSDRDSVFNVCVRTLLCVYVEAQRTAESYANVISSVYKLPQYENDSEKGNIELKNGCR